MALALFPAEVCAEDGGWRAPQRFAVMVPAELTLVGLGYGIQPELLYAPLSPNGPLQLRAATGITFGPELTLLSPLALGVRGRLFANRLVEPALGIGMRWHQFFPHGTHTRTRFDLYFELAASVRATGVWRADLTLSPEIGLLNVSGAGFERAFGLGMSVRLGVRRTLPW